MSEPEALVFGAELECKNGSMTSYLLADISADLICKIINGVPAKFVVTDCVPFDNIMPFGNCSAGSICSMQWEQADKVLSEKWENPIGQNESFGGEEIITTDSWLVCNEHGCCITPKNSGQHSGFGKQLMILQKLDRELVGFLMNPDNSIYTPVDVSKRVLNLLSRIVNDPLYEGKELFMAHSGSDYVIGPIILACIGHLAPSVDVVDQARFYETMQDVILNRGIKPYVDLRYLSNAEILQVLKAESEKCVKRVANNWLYKLLEENKGTTAILANMVNTAAYAAIFYSSASAWQRQGSSKNSYEQDYNDALTSQANKENSATNQGRTQIGVGGKDNGLTNASYAQTDYSPKFSTEGQKIYSKLTGERIVTIDDLANAIRNGRVSPADIPVQYIVRDGNTLILNTRTSQALVRAGIPMNQWNTVNETGVPFFEDSLTMRLANNGLSSAGTPTIVQK